MAVGSVFVHLKVLPVGRPTPQVPAEEVRGGCHRERGRAPPSPARTPATPSWSTATAAAQGVGAPDVRVRGAGADAPMTRTDARHRSSPDHFGLRATERCSGNASRRRGHRARPERRRGCCPVAAMPTPPGSPGAGVPVRRPPTGPRTWEYPPRSRRRADLRSREPRRDASQVDESSTLSRGIDPLEHSPATPLARATSEDATRPTTAR